MVEVIPLGAADPCAGTNGKHRHKSVTDGFVGLRGSCSHSKLSGAVVLTELSYHMALYKARVTDLPKCVSMFHCVIRASMGEISAGSCGAFDFSKPLT